MILTLLAPALAADPLALAHARYLEATGRLDEARVAARAIVEADPTDLDAQIAWLYRHDDIGPAAARALRASYARWLAEAPDDPVRRVAMGLVVAIDAAGGDAESVFPKVPGPWCDEVLGYFDPLPTDPADRASAVWQQALASARCGRDVGPIVGTLEALAATEPAARYPLAWALLRDDEVSAHDADVVALVMESDPWRMDALGLWGPDRRGEGLERARGVVLARARTEATSEDAVRVSAALTVLNATGAPEAAAALAALRRLDPERPWFPGVATGAPPPAHTPPPAPRLGDPAATLAELDATRADAKGRYDKLAWWSRRAEALAALGRHDEALAAWERAYLLDPGVGSNLRFAREAAARKARLRSALHAADVAVDRYERPERARWEDDGATALAEALRMRAAVYRALGRHDEAARDAKMSLLAEESRHGRALLGLSLAEEGRLDDAFVHLTRALAGGGTGDPALDTEARASLDALWPKTGWWTPAGLDGWLAAWAEAPGQPDGRAAVATLPFPDLRFTLDGREVTLASIEGPVVIDIWATWCGPCREALPLFDAAARRHADVTFLALSVDETMAEATTFLAGSTPAFKAAWAGPTAMATLGIQGIPATFFLDADHRIVDQHSGFSPGSDELEQSIRRLRAEAR